MKYIQLNDGNKIPSIGFGTYKATEQEGIESVKQALQNGYRLLDSAAKYENEEAVGLGIKESDIRRQEIFVTKKVNAEKWRAIKEQHHDGKLKSIGVSNSLIEHLENLVETSTVMSAITQIEFHPGYWQLKLKDYCNAKHNRIEAWSPLARGLC